MKENYGFEEYEGFVGSVDDFNGIIFCLREPHIKSKDDPSKKQEISKEFWFQRIVNEKEKYYQELKEKSTVKEIAVNKRIGTRFKNEFIGIFKQFEWNAAIENVAFCNVNPKGGGEHTGEEYKKTLEKAHEKIEEIIKQSPRDELCIFTCVDIYEKLKQAWKTQYEIEEKTNGVSYKNNVKKYFECQISNKIVRIYEIYHPSRRGNPLSQGTKNQVL